MSSIGEIINVEDNAFANAARQIMGLFLIGLAIATFFVPDFRVQFIAQLNAANLPLVRFSLFVIPALEGVAGVLLLSGALVRVASLVSMLVMGLVTYLELLATAPELFPHQFGLPLITIVGLVLSVFLYFVETYSDED